MTYLLSGLAERDAGQEERHDAQAAVAEATHDSLFEFTHFEKLIWNEPNSIGTYDINLKHDKLILMAVSYLDCHIRSGLWYFSRVGKDVSWENNRTRPWSFDRAHGRREIGSGRRRFFGYPFLRYRLGCLGYEEKLTLQRISVTVCIVGIVKTSYQKLLESYCKMVDYSDQQQHILCSGSEPYNTVILFSVFYHKFTGAPNNIEKTVLTYVSWWI